MNKLIIIAAVSMASLASLASVAVTSAWAGEATPDTTASQTFKVTKTRAAVIAELAQARADGSMAEWTTEYSAPCTVVASITREEVKAAMRVNRDAGLAAVLGEDSGSFYLSQQAQPGAATPLLARITRAGH